MTRKPTPARMARLVAQWRVSGVSQAAFARQHRMPTVDLLVLVPEGDGRAHRAAQAARADVRAGAGDGGHGGTGPGDHLARGGAPPGAERRLGGRGPRGRAGAPRDMLTISPAVRIYLATGATDLRRSIDGLSALVRERFTLDPALGPSVSVPQPARRSAEDSRVGSVWILGPLQTTRARHICLADGDGRWRRSKCGVPICCSCCLAPICRTRAGGAGMSASRERVPRGLYGDRR